MFKNIMTWYSQTARLVGYPILFIILITAIEKTMFTVTCAVGEYQCEHSLLKNSNVQKYVGDLVAGEPKQ
jgi:hypothetical protein